MRNSNIKPLALSLTMAVALGGIQSALAHTRLEIPVVNERARITNNVVIGHGCGPDKPVVGTSVVFPDGEDSTILVGGQPHSGPLTDFVENWKNIPQLIFSRAVFDVMDEKVDPNGNVVGFWAGGGPGIPNHLAGYVPFRLNAVNIKSDSCAKSVKFTVSIVDVCDITGPDALRSGTGEGSGVAGLWTHNNLGTVYDRVGETDNGPAPLTVSRDLTANPLPESCGEGVDVEVRPTAAQINRDMPIKYNGQQVWPQ